jgi:exodeoxyribonuclease VII small subunit
MGIDEILDRLEAVVQALEAGELPLEEALRRFEHGVGLARRGSTLLDAVEERVEQLLSDRDETVPLTSEEPR